MYETLKSQNFLFTCNMRSESVNEVVVVKSIVDYAPLFSGEKRKAIGNFIDDQQLTSNTNKIIRAMRRSYIFQ